MSNLTCAGQGVTRQAKTEVDHKKSSTPGGEGASDRAFGFVMAGASLLIALLPPLLGRPWHPWALLLSGLFAAAATLAPAALAPLNRAWMALGEALRRLTTPLVLGIIFFGVLTPMALLMRLFGKDLLRLRFDRAASSYWIARQPPGPTPETFKDQF